jgi:hypothetical protein
MGKDLERSGRGLILMYYPGICLEGLETTTNNSGQPSGLDFNPGPPEYEAGVLTNRPRCSVPISRVSIVVREERHLKWKHYSRYVKSLSVRLTMKAVRTPETSVNFNEITPRYIPQGCHLHYIF